MRRSLLAFCFLLVCFFVWIYLIANLWESPVALTAIIVTLTLFYFFQFEKPGDRTLYLIAAVLGPIGEALVSASGLWTYHGQTYFGIPPWLPLAWGLTAVVVVRVTKEISKN